VVPVLAFVIPPDGFDEERFSTEVRLESYANKGALDDSCRGTYSLLIGALPTWGYSGSWGYGPGGIVGLLLIVVIVLALTGRI